MSQNAVASYSQSGHEFVEVDMQDNWSETGQSFGNPLSRNCSTAGSVSYVHRDVKALTQDFRTHPEVDLKDQHKVPSCRQPETIDKQVNNAPETVDRNIERVMQQNVQTPNCSASTSLSPVVFESEPTIEPSVVEHARLLKRCSEQSDTLRKYKKKMDAKNLEIAELKDLVVHAVAEAKAAKEDPNANEVSHNLTLGSDQSECDERFWTTRRDF